MIVLKWLAISFGVVVVLSVGTYMSGKFYPAN